MATNTVEQIFVELLLNAKGYSKEADSAIKKNDQLESGLKKTEKQSVQTNKSFTSLIGGIGKVMKGVAGLAAVIAAGTGLLKLADEARKANDELNFLSQNLGMSSKEVKAWQGAAAAMGGSAQGMSGDMKNLNGAMNDFVMTGESSLLPMLNTLGVSMQKPNGELRDTNNVLLDIADSMSRMDREQAFLMGQKLGFDEGTINTLLQGRDAMQQMVDYHKQMYTSNKEELAASRQLSENQAKMSAHWQSMKLMMGNAVIPLLVKLSNIALRFFEFLQRHQATVKNVFEGMAIFLGMLVVPLLGKALLAVLAFIAPFAPFIAVIAGLAAAFVLLYDDYKTWAEGGQSLFNWGAFRDYIDNATLSTKNLRDAFKNLTSDMLSDTIPTLKGYADIVKALATGNFKEAGAIASGMLGNFSERVTGYVDTTTGQAKGTLSNKIGETIDNVLKGGGIGGVPESKKGGFNSVLMNAAKKAGITDKKELAAFTAIVGHETGDGKNLSENANYSYKGWKRIAPNQRNVRNWLAKNSESDFKKLSKEDKLNIMYEGMNGNRAGEGYKFRGRGAIQLTGRANYQAFANAIGRQDIMKNPDLVATDPELAAASAAWFWKNNKSIGARARAGDIKGARQIVNGGNIGMSDVLSRYNNAISSGASQAQASMPKANVPASVGATGGNKTNNVDVNVGKIEVHTSASTVSGTSSDAANAMHNKFYQLAGGL